MSTTQGPDNEAPGAGTDPAAPADATSPRESAEPEATQRRADPSPPNGPAEPAERSEPKSWSVPIRTPPSAGSNGDQVDADANGGSEDPGRDAGADGETEAAPASQGTAAEASGGELEETTELPEVPADAAPPGPAEPAKDDLAATAELPEVATPPPTRPTFEVRTTRRSDDGTGRPPTDRTQGPPAPTDPTTRQAPVSPGERTYGPAAPTDPTTRQAPVSPGERTYGPPPPGVATGRQPGERAYGPPPPSDTTGRRPGDQEESVRPRHLRPAAARRTDGAEPTPSSRRRLYLALGGAPVVLLVLLIVAWTVDATVLAGQVTRNVEVAGRSIGGESEDSLPEVLSAVAAEVAERPVNIVSTTDVSGLRAGLDIQVEEKTYTTTAGALGLTLDEDATLEAALDVGRDDPLFLRPFQWLGSFFNPREVPLHYTVSEVQTALTLQQLQGPDLTAPVEPTIQLGEAGFALVPGQPGVGIRAADVAEALPRAAEAVQDTDEPITINVEKTDVTPRFTDQEAQQLADRANSLTAQGLTVTADTMTVELSPQQLRSWITPTVTDNGLDLAFNTEAVNAEVPARFNEQGGQPVNATVRLEGGRPVVHPGQNGVTCCGTDAPTRIWDALNNGQATVELEATVSEPEWTTAEVEAWGISQPVGGNRAWRDGAAAPGPGPGFTTYHDCCLPRVTNIHRIADLVDGAVIPPGGSFSVNGHVGQRTTANGFVVAGAIRDGMHVDEVGGGVSQFATTLFNAAYFAGLDIAEYQAHTEYFTRYPRGREATMGYPNPDLVIENTTPYGILIDTSHTGSSLTVTLWSTPYVTAEQTGISETPSGACTVVTTTRTRTYQDGRTDTDTFRARYRPGEGIPC